MQLSLLGVFASKLTMGTASQCTHTHLYLCVCLFPYQKRTLFMMIYCFNSNLTAQSLFVCLFLAFSLSPYVYLSSLTVEIRPPFCQSIYLLIDAPVCDQFSLLSSSVDSSSMWTPTSCSLGSDTLL